jgi:TolB-like protein
VQLWQLMDNSVEAQTVSPATVKHMGADGATSYIIAGTNTKQHDRLGVIITRVDTREDLDTNGAYTIVLHPGS